LFASRPWRRRQGREANNSQGACAPQNFYPSAYQL
jgi:hypothetical protein